MKNLSAKLKIDDAVLAAGELAINTVDKKLFFEDSSGNIQEIKDSTTLAAEALADAVAMSVALG